MAQRPEAHLGTQRAVVVARERHASLEPKRIIYYFIVFEKMCPRSVFRFLSMCKKGTTFDLVLETTQETMTFIYIRRNLNNNINELVFRPASYNIHMNIIQREAD